MALSDQESSIIALFLESAFWGVFLVTFGLCLRTLLWTKSGELRPMSTVNRPMLAICLLMPFFSTVNLALNVLRAVESVGPKGLSEQFTNLGSATEIVKFLCVNIQTLIGDGMLVYRCWVVYARSWWFVVLPALLWLGVLATATLNIYVLANIHGSSLLAANSLRPVVTSFWCLSIALNIIATGLIVYKIQSVDTTNSKYFIASWASDGSRVHRRSRLQQTMRIIIESGMIYTTVAITTCATYVSGSSGVYLTSAIEMQTVGIAFNLIIIRVHNNKESEQIPHRPHQTFPLQFAGHSRRSQFGTIDAASPTDDDYSFKPATTPTATPPSSFNTQGAVYDVQKLETGEAN